MEASAYENTETRFPPKAYENSDPTGLRPQSYAEDDSAYQNMMPAPYNGATRQPDDPSRLHPSYAAYIGGRPNAGAARVEDVELGACKS